MALPVRRGSVRRHGRKQIAPKSLVQSGLANPADSIPNKFEFLYVQ